MRLSELSETHRIVIISKRGDCYGFWKWSDYKIISDKILGENEWWNWQLSGNVWEFSREPCNEGWLLWNLDACFQTQREHVKRGFSPIAIEKSLLVWCDWTRCSQLCSGHYRPYKVLDQPFDAKALHWCRTTCAPHSRTMKVEFNFQSHAIHQLLLCKGRQLKRREAPQNLPSHSMAS